MESGYDVERGNYVVIDHGDGLSTLYGQCRDFTVEEGDTVAAGEPLFEIETNKVVNQVEATVSGVLKKQLAEEGDTVCVDTAVAVVEAE